MLADVARRLGAIYAAQTPGLSKKDVTVQIAEAFAADMGAQSVKAAKPKQPPRKPAKKTAKKTARKKR